jgi:glutaredoxin 3
MLCSLSAGVRCPVKRALFQRSRHVGFVRGRHVDGTSSRRTLTQASLTADIIAKNKNNPCIVYSKTYCPYCSDVKDLFLKQLKVPAKVIELDTLADGDQVQAALMEISGMRTVPQVFVGGELVGGCDDTLAAYRNGSLETLLKQAGVGGA